MPASRLRYTRASDPAGIANCAVQGQTLGSDESTRKDHELLDLAAAGHASSGRQPSQVPYEPLRGVACPFLRVPGEDASMVRRIVREFERARGMARDANSDRAR